MVSYHLYFEGGYVGPNMVRWDSGSSIKLGFKDRAQVEVFTLDRTVRFDQVWVGVRTITGTEDVELGVYKDNGGYVAGDLIAKVTGSISATGIQRFSVDWTLSPGRYHLAFAAGTNSTTFEVAEQRPLANRWADGSVNSAYRESVSTLPDPWTGRIPATPISMGMRVANY